MRAAAEAYLAAEVAVHPALVVLKVDGGELVASPERTGADDVGKVGSILVLHTGTTAVAHVQWAGRAGWLTLLKESGAWIVISDVSSAAVGSCTPEDMAAAVKACWVEYCGANRTCDGPRMAEVFHPVCRLTYTGQDGALVLKPQDEFVKMVADRYTLPLHAPYAHLRDDPRVAAADSLLSTSFAAPDVCMVVLKVGHPPMLWTDVPPPPRGCAAAAATPAATRTAGTAAHQARAPAAGRSRGAA